MNASLIVLIAIIILLALPLAVAVNSIRSWKARRDDRLSFDQHRRQQEALLKQRKGSAAEVQRMNAWMVRS